MLIGNTRRTGQREGECAGKTGTGAGPRPDPPPQMPHSPDGLDDFMSSIVVFVLKDKMTGLELTEQSLYTPLMAGWPS